MYIIGGQHRIGKSLAVGRDYTVEVEVFGALLDFDFPGHRLVSERRQKHIVGIQAFAEALVLSGGEVVFVGFGDNSSLRHAFFVRFEWGGGLG